MAENTVADVMMDVLERLRTRPAEQAEALQTLRGVEASIQEVLRSMTATAVPASAEQGGEIMAASLAGLRMLEQAARKVRDYAASPSEGLAAESQQLAREGMALVDEARRSSRKQVQDMTDVSESQDQVDGLRGWIGR